MFLANYSDGLSDVNLDDMIEKFKKSDKIACFLAVHPPVTYHLADIADRRPRQRIHDLGQFRDLDQWRLLPA